MGLPTTGSAFMAGFNAATASTNAAPSTAKSNFSKAFANAYAAHAKLGVSSAITVTAVGQAQLELDILAMSSSSTQAIIDFATALKKFWVAEVTGLNGALPATSDAGTKQVAFEAAITNSVVYVSGGAITEGAFSKFLTETNLVVNGIVYKDWDVGVPTKVLLSSGGVT